MNETTDYMPITRQAWFDKAIARTLEAKVWIEPEDKIDDEFHGETGRKATAGGLIELPENYEDKANRTRIGIVRAVGEGWYDSNGTLHPLKLQVGDRVLFMKYKGQDATVDGVQYIIVHYNEILAVLHPKTRVDTNAV
jgi:chaperonin GroES